MVKSTISQFYRNKHGFIVICDLSDEASLKDVPFWITEINERSNILNPVIMVLANKCDLLDSIDQAIVVELENELKASYPNVLYKEASIMLNLDVHSSMRDFADKLAEQKSNFAWQYIEQV